MENYDKRHHDEFKRYEMMKEHERRERLKSLSGEERRREEQHYEEMKRKHAEHPKVNHPVRLRRFIFLNPVWNILSLHSVFMCVHRAVKTS